MNNAVIKVEDLSKLYRLGEIGTGTISRDLERWWARLRSKEDPFLKIGETNDRSTKGNTNMVWSLKDLSFEINQGDAVGIIGRNGAGKSTLLKILSRVTAPTTGSVKVKGRVASLLEVGTGFHPELTGRENIFLNGAILGMRKKEIARKLDEIIDFAGVDRYVDTPVKRYSSGMYVRLAFAVAAHLESEILIIDEVLAVGDAEFQKKCLGKMGEVSKGEGRTVLFVSHNMDSIKSICNVGIVLNNGIKSFQGGVFDTLNNYQKSSNIKGSHIINNYELSENITLKNLELNKSSLQSIENLSFNLSIKCNLKNTYNTIALLLYDEFEQKIAFIDLRSDRLYDKKSTSNTLKLSGELKNLPLLPGEYSIGLHINSTLVYKDFFKLVYFTVQQKQADNISPYPFDVRGKMELDYMFEYC